MGQAHEAVQHWEADVVLSDGGTAHLRPIRPDDGDLLRVFYARLSPETIYYRFFSPRPRLTDREIEHFINVDYDNRVALIAMIGNEMVAVVRYDKIGDGEAEVAFLVEDAQQGRGIGTVLLEHIAAAARERGIRRFVADVLPDNRRMSKVFREAGYEAVQRFEDGVIMLNLELAPTETSREVMAAREHHAESRSIQRLLFPRSVAVIGASREEHTVGQTVLRNLLQGDFTGPVFPVHPTAVAVAGVRAYQKVTDIPDPVDLAVVAVRADTVNDVVAQCAAKGVYGLIVVSKGFGEAGREGRARQEELVRLARAGGMRVVGPNCLGIANSDPEIRLNATLAPMLPGRGPVGFFSQSGALGIAILKWAAERGLGLSTFVSAGNRADVSGNDLMQYWEDDPATEVILLYLESIGNPRKFTRLARRISHTKPIVAVKSGRTLGRPAGRGSAGTGGVPLGHAAQALTLPDHAVSALFTQAGVVRVDNLTELFDVAQLFAYQRLPAGNRIAIVGNSDSLGLLAQDAATAAGLAPLPPVDLGPESGAREFETALASVLAEDHVDAVVTVFTPPVVGGMDPEVAEVIARLGSVAPQPERSRAPEEGAVSVRSEGQRDAASSMRPERPGEPAASLRSAGPEEAGAALWGRKPIVATYLGERGLLGGVVPSYPAPEDAVRALSYVVGYAEWRRRRHGQIPQPSDVDLAGARALVDKLVDRDALTDEETAAILGCYGIEVTSGGAGGVAAKITTSEDPSFGAIVSFGLADVTAELLEDRAYRLAPLTDVEAGELVRAVRAAPLLFGHHGAEPVDTAALERLLLRVSRLADDLPEVAHLELAPVTVGRDGVVIEHAQLKLSRPPGLRIDHGPRKLP